MINGKAKGNAFERRIANRLSERFRDRTGLESSFRRNPDSGSFFGGGNVARTATHSLDKASFGDIIPPAGFRFSIECKSYADAPSFAAIMAGKVADWDKWIAQAVADAEKCGKLPLLIVKYNRVPETALVSIEPANGFTLRYGTMYAMSLETLLANDDGMFFAATGST